MSYCINPKCSQRQNSDDEKCCQACGTKLFIHDERYRLVKPLRPLHDAYLTEIFEVEDREDTQTPKVLKVLKTDIDGDSSKIIELFKQEAKVLIDLEHPGIPKAELDGYFTFLTSKGQKLRCLVMEKIEGHNLERWVKQNGSISEEQAREWLRQIVKILLQVHQNKLFHRDIKPSNIMLRPDGQLVLIDFGVARKVTQTVINGQDVTIVYSHGYTAPEQTKGRAVPQSDFFALGRTFVYLLTSQHPDDLPRMSQADQLIWRDNAPQISQQFADLIDYLMAASPQDRPQDGKAILQRLQKITPGKFRNKWLIAGLGSGVVAVAILIGLITRLPKEAPCFFTKVPDVPRGEFKYGGSTTWVGIFRDVNPAIQKSLPEFSLKYVEPPPSICNVSGSSCGIRMLLAGMLDFSMSSRPLEAEDNKQAEQKGVFLEQLPVAIDAMAIVVNPQLIIPGLTLTDIKGIYTGKITNWQQVGGPDLAIAPIARPPEDSGTDWFFKEVLKGERFGSKVRYMGTGTEGLRQVAQDPGGIFYISAAQAVPQCTVRSLPIGEHPGKFIPPYQEPFVPLQFCAQQQNQVNQKAIRSGDYPLTRKLFVIVKHFEGKRNLEEQAGRAYANLLLTSVGQELIEKAGLVGIQPSDRVCTSP